MVLAFGFLLAIHGKHGRTIGKRQRLQTGSRWNLVAIMPGIVAVLFGVAFVGGQEEPLLVVGLVSSAGCLWLLYRMGGATLGDRGARIGWRSRRFEDFCEWRLTGDHARFRVEDNWLALEMPVEQQPPFRAKLEALCAQRESRFTD